MIKAFREKYKLSQAQLAILLNVGSVTISRWERSQQPYNETMLGLALEALERRFTQEKMGKGRNRR